MKFTRALFAAAILVALTAPVLASYTPNASVGTNGAAAPGSSAQQGCKDGSGNLQPAAAATPCPVQIGDGTNQLPIKPASTAPATTDPSAPVSISPNTTALCNGVIPINQTTSTDLKTFTNFGNICSIIIVSLTAQNVSLIDGTGTVCASNTNVLIGASTVDATHGIPFAANGGMSAVSGIPWLETQTTAHHLCLLQSGSGLISGIITYRDHT